MKRKKYTFFILLFIALNSLATIQFVRAGPDEIVAYPTTCLGGWANPQHAAGAPSLPTRASPEAFTQENSAVLEGKNAQLYCGQFAVVPIEKKVPQTITLRLSWVIKGAAELVPVVVGEEPGAAEIVAEEILNVPEDSAAVLVLPIEDEATPAEKSQPEPAQPNVQNEPLSQPVESDTVPVPNTAPTSFLWKLFGKVAFAQEVEQASSTESLGGPPEMIRAIPIPETLFEILYSKDGTLWKSVGTVTRAAMQEAVFKLPSGEFATWESVQNLQIRVERHVTLEDPIVYLESMHLTISYAPQEAIESVEVAALPGKLHISGILQDERVLPLRIERIENTETIKIVERDRAIGGIAIYKGDNEGTLVLTTYIDGYAYNIPADTLDEGNFTIIATHDPNHCAGKSRVSCATDEGVRINSFIITTAPMQAAQ